MRWFWNFYQLISNILNEFQWIFKSFEVFFISTFVFLNIFIQETQNGDEPENGQGKVVKEEEPQKPKMKAVVSMEEAQQRMKAGRFR